MTSSGKSQETNQAYEIDDTESGNSQQSDYDAPDYGDSLRWSGLSSAQAVPDSIAEPREDKSGAVEKEEHSLKS